MNARQRANMCTSKKRYKSKGEAIRAAERNQRIFKVRYRTYKCPICKGGWHNTTKENE